MNILEIKKYLRTFDPARDLAYTGTYTIVSDGGRDWRVKFLTSGTLTLYQSLTVDLFAVGGGGAGGGSSDTVGYGGAGGRTLTVTQLTLGPGEYSVTIGAGGVADSSTAGVPGGSSKMEFNSLALIEALGGEGGGTLTDGEPADGGSGGGGAGTGSTPGGAGGTNGGDGTSATYSGGTGQGTTTREFGETAGTLYGGGGGGKTGTASGGAGGAGGGGNGGNNTVASTAGTDNTGGGGGASYAPSNGGSGILIMRRHKAA